MPDDDERIVRLERRVAVLAEELATLKTFVADYIRAQMAVRERVSNELRDFIDRPPDLRPPGA